jgi:hypothetical protein
MKQKINTANNFSNNRFIIVEVLVILKMDEVLIGNGGDGFIWIFCR